jgi:hypothetical protein
MKWIATAVTVIALSGCGEQKPDNSMKAVAAKVREVYGHRDSVDELFTDAKMKPDQKERAGSRSFHARFAADDGYVWVRVSHGENESGPCNFQPETIQFSQSGKRE